MSDDCELLFFDTFSHDTCEELNLDLVQFPHPVYIFEIRVIPLGARVQADFPGGHRLGATNPSSFQLEFFVNDLSKRSASTFERLGSLDYKQNVEIQFPVANKIPTDGLVLRGWYSTVTLAVYGVITKVSNKDRSSPPPPPPPPHVNSRPPTQELCSKDFESSVSNSSIAEWDRNSRIPDAPPEPPPPPLRGVIEPHFGDVAPILHQPAPEHIPYSAELPVIGGFTEPPPPVPYQECVSVPQVIPTSSAYGQYDAHYNKPWPLPEAQYDHQIYNRPPDENLYQPNPDQSQPMWDIKDRLGGTNISSHERDNYVRGSLLEIPTIHRDKDLSKDRSRDRPWDRDLHDYKDDDRSRDHDSKRKDRGRRSRDSSWERSSADSDRYREKDRDRDRIRESSSRDRDRHRDRGSFMDRSGRKESKRPTTPPSPRKMRPHTPQSPPDHDRPGPRTPKEDEPSEMFDELHHGDVPPHNVNFYGDAPREHPPGEHMYNLSEGEIQDGENTEEDDGYEEIVSEEEDMSDGEERTLDIGEMDYDLSDESWSFMASFSPYQCELTGYRHFHDPTLFPFQIAELECKKEKDKVILEQKENEAEKILQSLAYPDDQDHDERWVEVLESITESTFMGLLSLKSSETFNGTINQLCEWVIEGLDFDLALNQPQTAYKVRHLKAGIRLATLLFETKEEIIQKLLDLNIPKFLIELFEQPHMTLPVKLLILRSIDAVIATQSGMEYITTKPLEFTAPKEFDTNKCKNNGAELSLSKTCYQKLLEFMTSKQLTRCVVAFSSLLNKIHTHEVLKELSSSVEKVIQNTEIQDIKSAPVDPSDIAESRAVSIEPELDAIDVIPNTCETLTQVLVSSLQEITNIYKNAWKQLAQTKRSLPARSQFEFQVSPFNPYPGLLRLFKQNKLLENIFVLLSSPALSGHLPILSAIKSLILELLESQEGMLFILSLPEVANGIQRTLLHTVDETREEASDENVAQNLGMQIVYHLQVLLFVDHLMMYHLKGDMKKELDDSEIVSLLHNLYTMMFTSIGKSSVVNVLSMGDNLNAIIPFVQISGDDVLNLKQSKSVCTSYATELLLQVVLFSDDALMIQKFSDSLFNISQQELTPKLHELAGWMAPTRNITNFTDEAIPSLMTTLKSHTENVATLPPELITALRMLQHIVLPKKSDSNESVELKYMYAIIQVFSNNGMESLKLILQNIATTFLKPSHQAASLVGVQGVLVMSIIKPAVIILKSILAHLISSRKTEFNDLTAVSILLKVYALMQLVPPSSFSHQQAEIVESEIIEALLTYTQPFLGSSESEEALSKSLWTEMVREILKFIQVEPDYFVPGLTVLSEMLPLPLPLQTREPLGSEEVTKMINLRKLWSAHLHSLCSTVQEVIVSLSTTSCHPLQQLLRRVCVQLADLAAPTALFIVRSVLDAVLEALVVPEQKENQDPATSQDKTPVLKPPSSTTARMLTLVAYLVSHAAIKIPLMQVLKGSLKADEKYVNVLPMMLELFNFPSDKPFVIQAQECTVSILQSFCDPDISFVTFETGASLTDVLCSSLPCNEHMSLICGALVRHIGCHNHSYSSVLPSLRTLVMLTEHDYGFFHVKQGLEQHPGAVYSLFTRFSLTFSKDSSDCLSTLSTTLEFLRFMVQGYEDGAQTGRTILLSACELAELLRGDIKEEGKSSAEPFQPIVELEKLLTEFGNDEEAVESLLESISSLLTLLNGASAKDSKNELPEPVLPIPENLSAQFALRSVFLVSGDVEEGRLSPAYWLALPGAEDTDQEIEQVTVDLINTAERCISGDFNLRNSLENLCLSIDVDGDLNSKKKPITTIGGKRKYSPLINPALIDVNNKRPFIAPMRGRGFSRASSHSSRINDPFRSRPPNTSRPPSMHVDDFLALESHHSAGNPGAQAKRTSKEGTRGRGRGFERNQVFPSTRGTGGRFFSPPGQYGRRDSNRGGNRGTNRLSSNTWGNRSNQNSGQKLSPGAGQRNSFGSHRKDYNSPFGQQDMRPGGQRNRDPYTDIRSSNIIQLGRFNRGSRTGGQQWQDNRNKSQNQRYY